MNLSDDFDPREPDLALLCKDGKEVKARSYIVMLASQPLLPAIKMALGEAASGRSSYQLAAPAGQCPDAAGSQHSEIPADMAVCRMEEDSAEAWQLLLQFLDPNQLHPDITWVSALGTAAGHNVARSAWPAAALLALLAWRRSCASAWN